MCRKIDRLALVCFLCCASVCAAAGERKKVLHQIGADFKPAYVFSTHEFFKGANAAQAPVRANLSAHLKYGFRFSPETPLGRGYPHAVQGIGLGCNTFFNPAELGNPLSLYIYQTARIVALAPGLSLDYEWNFGASFGWKKYDESSNPFNTVVGSRVNAYIGLGFLFNWQVTPRTGLRAGVGLAHYSNGNTGYPNAGVNTVGGTIGVTHYFGRVEKPEIFSAVPPAPPFTPHVSYDLILYGATRKKGASFAGGASVLVPGSFFVGGLNFTPMYNVNRYFRAGLSLDAQYDESANINGHIANTAGAPDAGDIRFHRPPFIEQFSLGLSVRAEVVMSVFSINVGVGRNFVCRGADTDSFYQIFAMKMNLTPNLFLHAGYQLYNFKYPNNLMLGIGFRFHAKP